MTVTEQAGTALTLERFWKWLQEHPNCLLRAGTPECFLYDHDALHWTLDEDPDHNLLIQLTLGKQVVGELIVEAQEVLFVQASPDPDAEEPGRFLFELVGGSREEPFPLCHFLVAHGLDAESIHQGALKH